MVPWLFIFLNIAILGCNSARILAFLPLGSHSHQNTHRPIFRALAARGHVVTYVTSLPDKNAPYNQIVVEDPFIHLGDDVDFYEMRKSSGFEVFYTLGSANEVAMDFLLSCAEVQTLIHSNDLRFDLVFTESLLAQEAYAAFGHKFQAPLIELTGLSPTFWMYHVLASPYSLAYTVSCITSSADKMSFTERVTNALLGVLNIIANRFILFPKQEALAEKYFRYPGWETRPPLMDLLANISLVLQNTHIATHYPHPYNPNIVEIAGVQLKEPSKLPKDLQEYLDQAKEGVIYFSLGSIVQSSLMPEAVKEAILTAFSKLPYKVLWKWETDLPDKPENVKISKWLPQKDLLAHPNIRLFMTHGGLASMTESIYHGVPIVLIPIFGDQWKNSKQVEANGNGVILDFDNITEQSILWSINTVLSQPSYKTAAERQSRILRDNPQHPVDKAVYWTEYVLRHKGAPHLRTAAASLTWYQYYLVDVIVVLLLTLIFIIVLLYTVMKYMYKWLLSKISGNEVKNRKKYN